MTKNLIRQGDLALIPTENLKAKIAGDMTHLTLAVGEDSGHAHAIVGKRLDNLLSVPDEALLVVEPATAAWRHAPLSVPAGDYEVVLQREYTPAGARNVAD